MKKVIFTIFALCVLCAGLQAQTPTTNTKGVTATGKLDTVRNTRVQTTPSVQTRFVSPIGKLGKRQSISRTGQRLKAKIVITNQIDIGSLTSTSATVQVAVTDSGDFVLPVIQRGVCYGTTPNPTMTTANTVDSPISGDGPGLGNFEVQISGLQLGITYHLRAYAVIVDDTVYGEDVTFPPAFFCGHDKMVDADGNTYETVMLGSQCWTKTNLRTKTFRNGTKIDSGEVSVDKASFFQPDINSNLSDNYQDYNDSVYGLYYNWYAAADTGNSHLCPEGWRVPNNESWNTMLKYVKSQPQYHCGGNSEYIAKALADSLHWYVEPEVHYDCSACINPQNNNATGFSAFPAGMYFVNYNNEYYGFDFSYSSAVFWSAGAEENAYYCLIKNNWQDVSFSPALSAPNEVTTKYGLSVRCVRDLPSVSLSCNSEKVSVCELASATVVYTATTETEPSRYSWSVSGGTGAVLANGGYSVTYTEPGSYTVSYTAVVSDTLVTKTIITEVGSSLPSFTYSQTDYTVTLNNRSFVNSINWGDGSATSDVSHTYTTAGTYTITVYNSDGCSSSVTVTAPFTCGTSKVMDNDGHEYETVQIGDQCWTKTNMRVAVGTNKTGTQDWSMTEPYYFVRPNVNDSIYGYYYNFPATVQVCPEGWHVPSEAEWDTMTHYVGTYKMGDVYKYRCPDGDYLHGETYIARALADSNGWKSTLELDPCMVGYNTAENNATGFSAYPAGIWDSYFKNEFEAAQFWSNDRRCYYIQYNDSVIGSDMDNDCFSVRCVRNLRLNLSSSADNNRALMCDDVTVNYQATLTEGEPDSCRWFISYPENSSSFSTSQAGNALSVTYHNTGNYIVNCVAYKSGKAVVNSITTQVVSNKPFFTYSRNGLSVTIDSIGEGCTIDWGCTTGTLSNNGRTYTYPSTDTYTITVTNQDNCAFTAVIAGLACKGIWSSNANETATGVAGNYTITAVRDHEDNEYPVVQIGSQCWLAENLRTTTSPSTGSYLVKQGEPMSYSRKVACWLNDDSTKYAPKHYGLLYNWCAAVDTFNAESDVYVYDYSDAPWAPVLNLNAAGYRRGICPEGWHIPTEDEWNTMITAAGASCDYEGTGSARLTTGTDWEKGYVIQNSYNSMPGNLKYEGRNASGFSALPAVDNSAMNEHFPDGFFEKASFWSSTQYSGNQYNIAVPSLLSWYAYVSWAHDMPKTALRSVRCLRDIEICTSEVPLTPCNVSQVHTSAQGYVSGTATEANTGGEETETTSGSKKITHVTDQEGNVYPVVQIGSQCWMAENMRATKYSTAISNAPALTDKTTSKAISSSSAYYYAPNGDAGNVSTYGYLYNWYAAVGGASGSATSPSGVQGICPKGWHVPSNDEINTLVSFTDASNAAGKLTKGCYWGESGTDAAPGNYLYENRNISGFGALPAGMLFVKVEGPSTRYVTELVSSYRGIDSIALFWTASTYNPLLSYLMGVAYFSHDVADDYDRCENGLSVRCLRNPVLDLSTVTTDTTVQHGWTVTGTLGANVKISIADGATVTLHGVNINGNGTWNTGDYAGITCLGDATLILEDSSTVKGFEGGYPGIYVFGDAEPSHDKTLTIMGTGTLNASSNGFGAGIGGGWNIDCGNIVITGGKVIATGGNCAAAIGGGNSSRCGNITIGGTAVVFATSESFGAGIGGSSEGVCGDITISGTAVVYATGADACAGIGAGGGGYNSSCGNILINGGTVEATGGNYAAGIGCGGKDGSSSSTCGTITITDGVTSVKATKRYESPYCIGKGKGNCSCGTITIGDENKGTDGVVGDIDENIYIFP